MLAGAHDFLGVCTRDASCTSMTCVSGSLVSALTLLPCASPIAVHFITNFGIGSNTVITQTTSFDLTNSARVTIILTSIDGGISLEVAIVNAYHNRDRNYT